MESTSTYERNRDERQRIGVSCRSSERIESDWKMENKWRADKREGDIDSLSRAQNKLTNSN